MKKLFSLFLVFAVLISCASCLEKPKDSVDVLADAPVVILFAGLDEAAENTQRGRLSATGRTEQSNKFTVSDIEID